MGLSAAPAQRRKRAVESFKSAADCIGELEPDMSLFAITRGQFSMIDAVMHVIRSLNQPCDVTLWTWTVAEYEIQSLDLLRTHRLVESARLVIDAGARSKNAALIAQWKGNFGPDSVRYVVNHAKIATIRCGTWKFLLRGSMNLNFNPRFEQFDLTEGGADFDLVREIEDELPILSDKSSNATVWQASKVTQAFDTKELEGFKQLKMWAK